jgi:hypothetical protein
MNQTSVRKAFFWGAVLASGLAVPAAANDGLPSGGSTIARLYVALLGTSP